MASEEDHTVYGEEDLDDDDDSEEEDLTLSTSIPPQEEEEEEEEEEDLDDDDDTSSSNLPAGPNPPPSSAEVTVAVAGVPNVDSVAPTHPGLVLTDSLPDPKRQRIDDVAIVAVAEEKKPAAAMDDSRRLFQRLWTDEDEIELLQGFLDYTTLRGGGNSSHHHDTTAFYDQIRSKLQLDFNKNQLVEKLRRLKKKYRNVMSKIGSGKDYVFKSPHDQATFEISKKIWSDAACRGGAVAAAGGGGEEGGLEDEEPNPNPNPNSFDHNINGVDANSSEKKVPRSRKRSRGVKIEETQQLNQQQFVQTATPTATSIPSLIEETVRGCLSPLFKELLHSAMNGPCGSRGFGGLVPLNAMPLSFGSPVAALNFTGGDMTDEKWRKQQILELEVYSKRLELVQDQIKSALEELRSMGS
ncbi:probable transcription factor At3g04930 [Diospyros lotus]|uniref:probable transcription factor At3g04930 n=1 Tax=Diospyros lotus TaxID=55363 RepID=UPI00225246EC|nr:probable transcription factor At3g04930 [Diospyros lotus]